MTKVHHYASSWVAILFLFGLSVTAEDTFNATNGTSVSNTTNACNIQCQHNTTCVRGSASFDGHPQPNGESLEFHQDINVNGYHCDCPEGLTGVDCRYTYITCQYGSEDSDDLMVVNCYHGGDCLSSIDDSPLPGLIYCDCTLASYNGSMYSGQYCEQEVEHAEFCADGEESYFCLNGGSCQPENPEQPCGCTKWFTGPHCELEYWMTPPKPTAKNTSTDDVECNLDCKNGGICLSGDTSNAKWGSQDGKYCSCPDNYAGLQCEYPAEVCGDGDLVCLHGSSCVQDNDGKYRCDRSQKRMEYCNPINFPEYSLGMAVPAFCVNGGRCLELVYGREV